MRHQKKIWWLGEEATFEYNTGIEANCVVVYALAEMG
jgi:hypothetical protein